MSFEGGVISLNDLVAQVSLYSSDSSVIITPSGQTINLQSSGGDLTQLNPIAIGIQAGETGQQTGAIAIGNGAGNTDQQSSSVAIGNGAGYTNQQGSSVAIGTGAGYTTQQSNSVAIGSNAGFSAQQNYSVAIGRDAGNTDQQAFSVAIGIGAGYNTQQDYSVAIGSSAGYTTQQDFSVAIGNGAGYTNQQSSSVAIGNNAGSVYQQNNAVAIGCNAGYTGQQSYSVAIGHDAGNIDQQAYSVAIGYQAGKTEQAANTIILNASGVPVDGVSGQTGSFYVAPIRGSTSSYVLGYDPVTFEITYGEPMSEGLMNRLQIVPTVTGQTVSTITYTTVGSPSAFIPDNTTFQPVIGGNNNGWRCTKQVGTSGTSTKIAWYQYNPNYGLSLPYSVNPSPAFTKQQLKSVYAIVYTKNRITTQGQIFFNIFTYNIASPPVTQPSWTTRFDYSIGQYATPLGTGSIAGTTQTLVGGYRYLICCVDTPKIVQQTTATVIATALVIGTEYTILTLGTTNFTLYGAAVNTIGCVFTASSVGLGTGTATRLVDTVTSGGTILASGVQTPGQIGFLRDPYDIHTDIPHVPFNAGLIVTGGNTQPGNISAVPVIGIAVSTDSGTVPVTADFTVEAIGFSADNGSGTANFEYNLNFN